MRAMTIMACFLLAGMAWAGSKTPEFLLLHQGRSNDLQLETKEGNLRIDGIEVDFEVMPRAAISYRVTDVLFAVQARSFEMGGLILWDSTEKKVRARMTGSLFPALVPVAGKWQVIQNVEGDGGFYGIDPSKKDFVRISPVGLEELVGGSEGRLFFLERSVDPDKPLEANALVESSLNVIESGKEPVKIKVGFGDFRPVGSDSIRGNNLLLIKLLNGERVEAKTPPRYEVAVWDLAENKLKTLGEVSGTWMKFRGPPPKGGGRSETHWSPYLQIWWLPEGQKRKPGGYSPRYRAHFVDPATFEITSIEPEASGDRK